MSEWNEWKLRKASHLLLVLDVNATGHYNSETEYAIVDVLHRYDVEDANGAALEILDALHELADKRAKARRA